MRKLPFLTCDMQRHCLACYRYIAVSSIIGQLRLRGNSMKTPHFLRKT